MLSSLYLPLKQAVGSFWWDISATESSI